MIDFAELRRIARFRRSELFLALATTAAVLIFDVLYGIAVAVGLSILDLLRRIARPHDGILGYVPGLAGMHDIDDYATGRQVPGLLVYRYDAPLFFANAEDFKRRAVASVDSCGYSRGVVFVERRGQHRDRPHSSRRAGGATQDAVGARHRLRAR